MSKVLTYAPDQKGKIRMCGEYADHIKINLFDLGKEEFII